MSKKTISYLLLRFFKSFVVFISLFFSLESFCQRSGNENTFGWYEPIRYIVNGSFDVSQNDNWFDQSDFYEKNKLAWRRVRSPVGSIRKDGGFSRFIKDEFLSDRAIPNYLLHTIGGSYDGAWLTRYYEQRDFSNPFLYAVLTSYLARWGNEVLEAGNVNISSHDHIADLFFFDSLGLIFSKNEKFMSFLTKDMGMRAWHSIPYYDPEKENFINSGLNYIVRPKALRVGKNYIPFFYFGMQNIFGISYLSNENTFSIGSGIFLTDPLERKMRLVTGFFYERNQNLAFSAFINGSEGFKWRVNLYPKLLQVFEHFSISMLLGERRSLLSSDYALGLNINMPFGLSFF